jgi:diguanylate cyclase (GGDEF)-like protein
VEPASPDTPSFDIKSRFGADPHLYAIPIVDAADLPIGLLNRFQFLEHLATPFGHALCTHRPVSVFMQPAPLVVDERTGLDQLETLLLGRRTNAPFDALIVSRDGRYYGVCSGIDVMGALAECRQADLLHLAHHDDLTGLANRHHFEICLHEALEANGPTPASAALLFIDVDRFKQVNDTFGHRIGDLVLRAVGQRLCHYVRASDVVARLSGDEFAIILRQLSDERAAEAVAAGILGACATPLPIEDHEIVMSCSIGLAIAPIDATTPSELMRAADAAVYHAKQVRNTFHRYTRDQTHPHPAPALSFTSLRQIISRGELAVHYQPQVDLATGAICGVEALLRSDRPEGAALPTDEIIRLAEDSGLIIAISEWVIRTAMADVLRWSDIAASDRLHLAVNISAVQVGAGGLIAMLDRLSSEMAFDTDRLELELTESAAMQQSNSTQATLEALRERGYLLAVDDFGTGYSSLSRLERLPVDILKIDRRFVSGLGTRGRRGAIAKAIVALGRSLRLRVVGEGIETATQLRHLRKAGCHTGQGYYLGVPMPADEMRQHLRHDVERPRLIKFAYR